MHLNPLRRALLVLATMLSAAVPSQAPAAGGRLPSLSGDNLNSRRLTLPADLPADPALLFIAFHRDQQGQVDSWTRALNDSAAIPWLEVPVIEPSNAFVRAMIAGGMRRDISAPDIRERVLTVYTDPAVVAQAVGCLDYRKGLCVAVAERSGRIRLVLTGGYSPESAKRVLEVLATAGRPQAPVP